jgi:hypothetical protein
LSVFGLVTLPNRVNRLHEPDIPRSVGPPERPILGLRDLGTERSFWKSVGLVSRRERPHFGTLLTSTSASVSVSLSVDHGR